MHEQQKENLGLVFKTPTLIIRQHQEVNVEEGTQTHVHKMIIILLDGVKGVDCSSNASLDETTSTSV